MRAKLRSCVPSAAACASAALTLFTVACSTPTAETSVWKSPTYAAGPMKKIAIFGGGLNDADRRTVEDGFVSTLAAYGVHATQSYTIFPQSLVRLARSSFRVGRAKVTAVQAGAVRWEGRVARSIEPIGGCVG
jgi:hypothetical protein